MKSIYLDKKEEKRFPKGEFVVDPVPPKSTYYDHNRSDITVSETFKTPSDETIKKVCESFEKQFQK